MDGRTVVTDAAQIFVTCSHSLVTFGRTFFPKTMKQESPPMHHDMSDALLNPAALYIAFNMFRGSAKTSLARIYVALRVAYALSRTLVIVGLSEAHAIRSLRWIKKQIEFNTGFANFFGLARGDKWTDTHIEIRNTRFDVTISIIAMGISGNTRGINLDDHRPDFILVDDPCDIENTATDEQIKKTNARFFADLAQSLTPKTENPLAQMVLLQTSLAFGDLIYEAERDPQFVFRKYSCFTDSGESAWPERFPTEVLRAQKEAYIRRNQLSIWLREMECTVLSTEDKSFRRAWLQFYYELPEGMETIIAVDPASSESKKADFNAIAVIGRHGKNRYLLDYHLSKGTMPDECAAKFYELVQRWGVKRARVEIIGYQRVLVRTLEDKGKELRIYVHIDKVQDRRKKSDRIIQSFTQIAPFGNLWVRDSQIEFIEAFERYTPGSKDKDDLLDAISMALDDTSSAGLLADNDWIEGEYKRLNDAPELEGASHDWMSAP